MTKLKIIEKISDPVSGKFDISDLAGGDMLYSYDCDTLIMIVDLGTDQLMIVDFAEGNLVEEDEDALFEDVFNKYNHLYGPFFMVSKAKITFKVGD